MIQLIVNTNMLREIDERKLIRAYARLCYDSEEDTSNETKIQDNLTKLLDWDKSGSDGLGIFCSKYENIKRRDWPILIDFIKENYYEIKTLAYAPRKIKRIEFQKRIDSIKEARERHYRERCINENYKVSGRGVKARPCVYEGREYKSRFECMYKEGITQNQLYRYLEKTNQV